MTVLFDFNEAFKAIQLGPADVDTELQRLYFGDTKNGTTF